MRVAVVIHGGDFSRKPSQVPVHDWYCVGQDPALHDTTRHDRPNPTLPSANSGAPTPFTHSTHLRLAKRPLVVYRYAGMLTWKAGMARREPANRRMGIYFEMSEVGETGGMEGKGRG